MPDADAPISLRLARQADAPLLLEWRNEPATREASGNRERVTSGEHRAWLKSVLADPDRHLLIAEADAKPIGQARIERRQAYRYELSVSLDPAARGRGTGATLIAGVCEWAWTATDATVIEAWVRSENEASLRAFAKAGFSPGDGERHGFVSLWLVRPSR